jgi:hypothetical protein
MIIVILPLGIGIIVIVVSFKKLGSYRVESEDNGGYFGFGKGR